ncbi:hypothetical protein EDB19DRAFT_1825403 [Suillus lakei]|nr:hypothetical protein EDB19DRAFT_1825403 [Suillus lakei]
MSSGGLLVMMVLIFELLPNDLVQLNALNFVKDGSCDVRDIDAGANDIDMGLECKDLLKEGLSKGEMMMEMTNGANIQWFWAWGGCSRLWCQVPAPREVHEGGWGMCQDERDKKDMHPGNTASAQCPGSSQTGGPQHWGHSPSEGVVSSRFQGESWGMYAESWRGQDEHSLIGHLKSGHPELFA